MNAQDTVTLNDQIKNFLLGLVKGAARDAKAGCVPLISNALAVAVAIGAPSIAIVLFAAQLANQMAPHGEANTAAAMLVGSAVLLCQIGALTACMGMLTVFAKVIRGAKVGNFEALQGYSKIWSMIAAQLMLAPLFAVGMLLAFIPGIYLALRASLVPIVIADENVGPIKAIKRSFELTKGRTFELGLLIGALAVTQYFLMAVCIFGCALFPPAAGVAVMFVASSLYFTLIKYYVSINPVKPEVAAAAVNEASAEQPQVGGESAAVCPA
jgi:uncharacterized membrane protein